VWIACLAVLLVLYAGVWLGIYFGFKDWSAQRGVPLSGRSARLVTSALVMLAWWPFDFIGGWICRLLGVR
jgi:hypothetical protein